MTIVRAGLAGCLLAVALPLPATAQEAAAPAALGRRVRAWTSSSDRPALGTLVADDGPDIVIAGGDGTLVTVSKRSLTRLQVSTGTRSRAGRGAFAGGAIGLGLGLMFSVIGCELGCDNSALSVGAATVGGTLMGAVIGGRVRSDTWSPVPLSDPVGATTTRFPGPRVALTIRF